MDQLDPAKPDLKQITDTRQVNRVTEAQKTRSVMWVLALAGAFPFIILTLFVLFTDLHSPLHPLFVDGLKTYAVIILSFLGGIRWGLAMKSPQPERVRWVFWASNIGPVLGWFTLILPIPLVFAVQAMLFAAHGAWDSLAGQKGLYGLWFVKLRSVLTGIVVFCLLVAFLATIG